MDEPSLRALPPARETDPIFILGISERSGTNFLFHLLCLHPDCHYGGPIWENYLTLHLHTLERFADQVYREWNPEWKVDEVIGPKSVLLGDLGDGLTHYLNRQLPEAVATESGAASEASAPRWRRLVTKTPSVRNLAVIPRVFPRARLLILVRDGRSVVESGVRSFHLSYERAMREWAAAGRNILRFLEQPPAPQARHLLVRYEELFQHTEEQLRRIFAFLELPADAYDFAAAQRLPVVGSSDLAQQGQREVHWRGVQKQAGFDPTRRWENWPTARRDRFHWIAGSVSQKLGYPTEPPAGPTWLWTLRNRAQDALWRWRSGRK